jgi:t-SNARE complex subunit (syntaxin)
MSEYTSLLIDEDDIAEREEAITRIHEEMLDIHDIFKTLANLSHDQGYLLDNIESNIDDVVINVERADEELISADKKQQKYNKCLWSILILLLIILLITTLILTLK